MTMADLNTTTSTTGSIPTAANKHRNKRPARGQGRTQDQVIHSAPAGHTKRQPHATDCRRSYLYGVIRTKFRTQRTKFRTRAFLRRVRTKFSTQGRRACEISYARVKFDKFLEKRPTTRNFAAWLKGFAYLQRKSSVPARSRTRPHRRCHTPPPGEVSRDSATNFPKWFFFFVFVFFTWIAMLGSY